MMTFDHLYRTYFEDVHRFAFWLSGNRTEADDLASETFVRAWSRRNRLQTETLKAYLLVITRNAFLDSRRRTRHREELSEEWPDATPDPHRQAAARIALHRIRSELARLPESERLALALRAEESLSYSEIARVLGISQGAARIKVHRARRRLLDLQLTRPGGV
jgi:RNA polymerase sigma-70 factor (ECF subfamily)